MSSLAYPNHIRNIEADEKCQFCDKTHTSHIQVFSNAGRYTSIFKVPFCDDHKKEAEELKHKRENATVKRESRGDAWD